MFGWFKTKQRKFIEGVIASGEKPYVWSGDKFYHMVFAEFKITISSDNWVSIQSDGNYIFSPWFYPSIYQLIKDAYLTEIFIEEYEKKPALNNKINKLIEKYTT